MRRSDQPRDPLEALERAKAAGRAKRPATRSQVDGLQEPIVHINHGRGMGVYITRWITTSNGKVLEHEERTEGIAALSRLLRDTIRRSDAEHIIQDIKRTAAYRREVTAPYTTAAALREPDERRRREAMEGMQPAWKLDRDPEQDA